MRLWLAVTAMTKPLSPDKIGQKAVRLRNTGPIQMDTRRVMTPEQVKERAELNAANTAEAIHRRANAGWNGK